MPAISNMTVKKNDGTTDVTYTYSMGASGDVPATWFAPALGANASTRPELRFTSKAIPGKPYQRKVVGTFMYPYHVLNTTTGITSVEKKAILRVEGTTDFDIPQSSLDEWASQGLNLFAHALVKSSFKEGAAAT